ncbi:MAG: glycine cleavage system aminomethyltransferase GcvT [Bacteroidetes bacterium]|jgi:aminomethyltransferase|nr:glycine cleavage system aminomethyltransferase GcvT [Bacteroidota bacterium]MBT3749064.1 glycine cleavage system aminomethyltransferase GcvT [Bacteroidota bacterium]MBT4400954.1 glycine cleavage system aminomethyltransferase GcvT [Bacteroidota bacterium]MBT4408954.1 glycine cleavage system aminomethyltransferase GcvT [Bacteroidota bacterium]MBT7095705.1 glycine cleavage system aminomethyltransferase GcvT [Bacteroidota bacterium]
MKETPFYTFHEQLGARLESFAGYKMPIEYSGIKDEHMAVRNKLGVFDVSHMGEFWVKGPGAFKLVQSLTTNDVAALYDGKVQYTCFPNGKGGIVDDLLVYRVNSELYLLVVNAANIEKDWDWCQQHAVNQGLIIGKDLVNASDETAQLAIQGPLALKAMQKLCDEQVEDMEYYTFKQISFAGIPEVLFSTTGYTGSGGCEIYCSNEDAPTLWNAVMDAGKEFGIQAIGLGARDTLRLEMGFCLYGNDITDQTSAIEGGLGWITKFVDGNNFIDRELLEQQKADKPVRRLRGFLMKERGIPRHDYEIKNLDGEKIGIVTSGTMAPALGQGIGMGYIDTAYAGFGKEIFIQIRNKTIKAEIVKLPFYK